MIRRSGQLLDSSSHHSKRRVFTFGLWSTPVHPPFFVGGIGGILPEVVRCRDRRHRSVARDDGTVLIRPFRLDMYLYRSFLMMLALLTVIGVLTGHRPGFSRSRIRLQGKARDDDVASTAARCPAGACLEAVRPRSIERLSVARSGSTSLRNGSSCGGVQAPPRCRRVRHLPFVLTHHSLGEFLAPIITKPGIDHIYAAIFTCFMKASSLDRSSMERRTP